VYAIDLRFDIILQNEAAMAQTQELRAKVDQLTQLLRMATSHALPVVGRQQSSTIKGGGLNPVTVSTGRRGKGDPTITEFSE
jgi:hypothetical protein